MMLKPPVSLDGVKKCFASTTPSAAGSAQDHTRACATVGNGASSSCVPGITRRCIKACNIVIMCAAFDRYHAFRNFDGPQGGWTGVEGLCMAVLSACGQLLVARLALYCTVQ